MSNHEHLMCLSLLTSFCLLCAALVHKQWLALSLAHLLFTGFFLYLLLQELLFLFRQAKENQE